MQCGISTACFYPQRLEETITDIQALDIKTIEVFVNTESEFQPDYICALRARLEQADIRVISVHPYTSPMEGQLLLSEYDRRTEDGIAQYRRYFDAASALGAKYLTFHGERSIIQDRDAADTMRKLQVYRRLCEVGRESGIVLAQENVAWCKSENLEYLRWLREGVPALRFTLDIKQAHRAGHSWSEYLDIMGDRLVNVHINDFDESHSCMLPGEGAMRFDAFFSRLHDIGYDEQVLVEVYRSNYQNAAQIKKSIEYLNTMKNG